MNDFTAAVTTLADWIAARHRPDTLLRFGISGAQGSGKTTFANALAGLLSSEKNLSTAVLSLDDFYRTREQRTHLAKTVHPLMAVRGVPGTHDMARLRAVLEAMAEAREVTIPRFDKALDDRTDKPVVIPGNRDVVIVEGWCWGAKPAEPHELIEPVNRLEAIHDPDARWRRYVNDCLAADDYQIPFQATDGLAYLAVPDMEAVYRWRLQQEKELAGRREGENIMDETKIRAFIMYYERITRRMLTDLPTRADITIRLNDNHSVADVSLRH